MTTLVIGDVHEPFAHERYLSFCDELYDKWECTTVVFIGDLVDNHAISRHLTETDAFSAEEEHSLVMSKLQGWYDAFPEAYFCLGNHDRIPQRQAATIGLGQNYIKTFQEIYQTPELWTVDTSFTIDDVFYTHGLNCGGKDGALNLAISERMSAVIGHFHGFLGVKYHKNTRDLIFGMNVGCGICSKQYAFNYGRNSKIKETLGAGIVVNSSEAYAIPMPMGDRK